MQSEQQFNQLMIQYEQLKNGAIEIAAMIAREDYDSAITLIKTREQTFLSCKCIRRYLEMTPDQQKKADKIFNEIKDIELQNIHKLEEGMKNIQSELIKTQKSQKLHNAYTNNSVNPNGNIVNFEK